MVRIKWFAAGALVCVRLEPSPVIKSWRVPGSAPQPPIPGSIRVQVEKYQYPDNVEGDDSATALATAQAAAEEPQPCRVEWGTLTSVLPRLLNPHGHYRLPVGRLTGPSPNSGFILESDPDPESQEVARLWRREVAKAMPHRVQAGTAVGQWERA